ncbi:MAG: hypothetical protein A3F09_01830 [Chlamydiae bacterium RIFCSPHIGHO2_12_FULL_49_11]|nr:MAG: hypothetical protein A3F09_01830 [Chlamydiae bacterium RIFCSPHIGHO2_12_FULL_49_11]
MEGKRKFGYGVAPVGFTYPSFASVSEYGIPPLFWDRDAESGGRAGQKAELQNGAAKSFTPVLQVYESTLSL